MILDVEGFVEFNKLYGDRTVGIFIEVDEQTRKERCIGRKDFDESEWQRREKADTISFEGYQDLYDAIFTGYDSDLLFENIETFLKLRGENNE